MEVTARARVPFSMEVGIPEGANAFYEKPTTRMKQSKDIKHVLF